MFSSSGHFVMIVSSLVMVSFFSRSIHLVLQARMWIRMRRFEMMDEIEYCAAHVAQRQRVACGAFFE